MIFRLILIVMILFAVFHFALRQLFKKGYMTRERLKNWTFASAMSLLTVIAVIIVVAVLATADQVL